MRAILPQGCGTVSVSENVRWYMRSLRVLVGVSVVLAACTTSSGTVDQSLLPSTSAQQPQATVSTSGSESVTTSTVGPSSTSTTVTPPTVTVPLAVAIEGWQPTGTDPAMFGAVTITDAELVDGKVIAVGCPREGEPGFPIWVSNDAVSWERATGPSEVGHLPIGCLTDVVATPFGIFAHGFGLLRSSDGRVWEPVEFLTDEGYSKGYVDALFPTEDRLTVLLQRGSEGESTIATLYTAIDGVTWQEGPAGAADLFDSAEVGDVIDTKDGLIAVGASPWGQFVPTAAVWTSPDGLDWRLVTPQGAGFLDAYMHTVTETDAGYVALGGSPFGTSLMAAWTSPDGTSWNRLPSPIGDAAAEHGYMEAYAITAIDTRLYAAGLDFDAGRSVDELPALWASTHAPTWKRQVTPETERLVPFTIVELTDHSIGFWPPPFWPDKQPVHVLTTIR